MYTGVQPHPTFPPYISALLQCLSRSCADARPPPLALILTLICSSASPLTFSVLDKALKRIRRDGQLIHLQATFEGAGEVHFVAENPEHYGAQTRESSVDVLLVCPPAGHMMNSYKGTLFQHRSTCAMTLENHGPRKGDRP